MGDMCKLGMGGSKYGLDIWFVVILLYIFFKRIFLLLEVEFKFFEKIEMCGLEYCNLKLCFRLFFKYFVEILFGYWFK